MNFIQKHAGKVTKVLVAGVVLGSVSFGAYGFGRAARTAVADPRDAVYKQFDTWQPLKAYCNGGCAWDKMNSIVRLSLPEGKYAITVTAELSNQSDTTQYIDCEFIDRDGADVEIVYSQATLHAGDTGNVALISYAIVPRDFAKVVLRCGTRGATADYVDIGQATIMAQRVNSIRTVRNPR